MHEMRGDQMTTSTESLYLDMAGEERLYRAMRHFWHPVMKSKDLIHGPEQVVLLGEELVLARLDGAVRCFPDLCLHRGAALSLGFVEDDQLRCLYHGWTYGPDGRCTSIPARFGQRIPSRANLTAYRVEERYGLIWACLESEPRNSIPEFPELDDPDFRVTLGHVYDWDSSAHRRVENFVDFAHFAWVHDGILGSRDHPEVEEHDVWREDGILRFHRDRREPKDYRQVSGVPGQGTAHSGDWVDVEYQYHLTMPLTVHFDRKLIAGGEHYVLLTTASPIGPKKCRSFWFLARNFAIEDADQDFLDFERTVQEQDRPVVESQRPEMLPFDLTEELHIRGADKVSVEYRRWLIELTDELIPKEKGQ